MIKYSVSAFWSILMTLWASILLFAGVCFSQMGAVGLWMVGQAVLVIFFNFTFCLMHEYGHHSYFKNRNLNWFFGVASGFFCMIPFPCWQKIHHLHHQWTGWRDLDPTTRVTTVAPSAATAKLMNFCWRFWIPIFSVAYRVNTYWNVSLLRQELSKGEFRRCLVSIFIQGTAYGVVIFIFGAASLFHLFGVSFLVSLSLMDPILLSQHSHIEMPLGKSSLTTPRPQNVIQQVQYTRSIVFPKWISLLCLSGFDRHEEHHRNPSVPGYGLSLGVPSYARSYPAWSWIASAKKIPADVLIFSTEAKTQLKI